MKTKLVKYILPSTLMATPFVVLAATATKLGDWVTTLDTLISNITPVIIAFAFVVFAWGIILYLTAAGDEEKTAKGKRFMLWGVIGLAVMIAVWGFAQVLINTAGVGGVSTPTTPGGL